MKVLEFYEFMKKYIPNRYTLQIWGDGFAILENLKQALDNKIEWETIIDPYENIFYFSVLEKEEDPYFDFITFFLDIIEKEKTTFKKLKIKKKDISIWRYYKFENQCNMEYSAEKMLRLGKSGITLCISCMEMAGDNYIKIGDKKVLKNNWF